MSERKICFSVNNLELKGSENFLVMMESVCCRIVNIKKAKQWSLTVPFLPFLDLAIVFYIEVAVEKEGICSVMVTQQMLEIWGVDILDLYEIARENTISFFPAVSNSLPHVLDEVTRTGSFSDDYPDLKQEIKELYDSKVANSMLVVTNHYKYNGATCILYEAFMNKLGEGYQSDYYILPSSIHEILFIPKYLGYERKDLFDMVCDINKTQVKEDDWLADNVYLYHKDNGKIEVLF